ncbi:MAG: hypothetical protein WC838_03820 [Candidatus Margulisiibacteriota bacterium]|jgi:hypothetical protein
MITRKYLAMSLLFCLMISAASAATVNATLSLHPHQAIVMLGSNGRASLPMLKAALSANGGRITLTSLIVTNNGQVPFITSAGQYNGVTRISLYQDNATGTAPNEFDNADTLLCNVAMDGTSNTAGSALLSGLNLQLDDGASALLFVVYDLGGSSTLFGQTFTTKVSSLNVSDTLVLNQSGDSSVGLSGGLIASIDDISSDYIFRREAQQAMLKVTLSLSGEPMQNIKISLNNDRANFNSTVFEAVRVYQDDAAAGTLGSFDSSDQLKEVVSAFNDTSSLTFTLTSGNYYTTGNYSFFIVYDIQPGCPVTTHVRAQISSIQLLGQTSGETGTALGTLPAPTTPADSQVIDVYTLRLSDISAPLTRPVYQGAVKVPVLAFKLQKLDASLGNSISIRFRNNGSCAFNNYASGVSRVWLFKDNPDNSIGSPGSYDSQDTLVAMSSSYINETKDVLISDIALSSGAANTFFLLYDLGAAASGTLNANIQEILSTGMLLMETALPHSLTASTNVLSAPLSILGITTNTALIDIRTSRDILVTMNLQNNLSVPIRLSYAGPAVYQDTINGRDRTAEYLLIHLSSFPLTINPGITDIGIKVSTANIINKGTMLLDGLVQYVSSNLTAVLSRYLVGTDQYSRAVSGSAAYWQVDLSQAQNTWDQPNHVLTVNTVYLGNAQRFESGDAFSSGALIKIYFNQNVIDENSFRVYFNNTMCTKVERNPNGIYEYNYDSIQGLFSSMVPTVSGTFKVSLLDKSGSSLSDLNLIMTLSDQFRLSDLLLYPNPFAVNGTSTLTFAFNINKASWLDIYLLNAAGQLIWHSLDNYFGTIGYNELKTWTGALDTGNYLASGIYSVRVIARDINGKRSTARAKLAVR